MSQVRRQVVGTPASSAPKAPAKSTEGTKAAKTTSSKPAGDGSEDKKKCQKFHQVTYSSYIYKILKQAHPDTGISNKAIAIANSFVNGIFEHIATEASKFRSTSHNMGIQRVVSLRCRCSSS